MTSQKTSLGELNEQYFDSVAKTAYALPWVQNLVSEITGFLRENIQWLDIPQPTTGVKMLDYACGSGVASRALAPFVTVLRGIDSSGGMVDEYNQAARRQGLSGEQMNAVRGDLLATAIGTLDQPDLFGFHVTVICMALHHVVEPAELVRRLTERLEPGGVLLVVDGVAPSESGFEMPPEVQELASAKTIASYGFTRQEMLDMFAGAGLVEAEVRWHPAPTDLPPQMGGKGQLFYARAKRPRISA